MKSIIVLASLLLASMALGHATHTGYSGSPGSGGPCAGQCHGTPGGTITVAGFPTFYTPGQAYVITIAHNGGSSIENFNASVRVGSGSTNAGAITVGTNTEVYNVSGEANGVHFATSGQTSGTFTWTAPSPSVGAVKLYVAGHQGTSVDGKNTEIVLTANGAGIAEAGSMKVPVQFRLEQTVVTSQLVMRIDHPQAPARIRVIDRNGRIVGRMIVAAGSNQAIAWPLLDNRGAKLAAGSYFVTFATPGTFRVAKFAVAAR
jgi:hypothetical protein